MLLLWMGQALAGGPWVIGTGQVNGYLGLETQRLERLQIQDDGGADAEVIDVDSGLSTVGAKGIVTIGLAPRAVVSLDVPVYRVMSNRSGALCDALGMQACETTTGLGPITVIAKGLVFDELAGAPLSVAVALEGRIGAFTHDTRQRITNVGEGTQDLGGILSLGRSGGLGQGYWAAWLDVGARHRLPNTRAFPQQQGSQRAPREELHLATEVLLSPDRRFGFGPSVHGLYRPGGVDFKQVDLTDPDRLAALRVANLRVGGTLVVRSDSGLSANLSALHTVGAMNNPYVTVVSVGMSLYGGLGRRSR